MASSCGRRGGASAAARLVIRVSTSGIGWPWVQVPTQAFFSSLQRPAKWPPILSIVKLN